MVERPMPPILALDKISKRFGAVVVAQAIDLTLADGEALGIIGPNGAGKTTLFGIVTGTVRARRRPRRLRGKRHHARSRRNAAAAWASARSFQIPQPFDGMTRVREPGRGGGVRRRAQRARRLSALRRVARALRPGRQGQQAGRRLTLLDRKRLELARALATAAAVLLLDEVAGGLTEHECAALVDLIKDVHRSGVSIVWIEHVVHALLAVVDRLLVLHGGGFIARGRPDRP